jgi:putative transposase
VLVHPANEQDQVAGRWLLRRIPFSPRWELILFDQGYNNETLLLWCQQVLGVRTEIVRREAGKGFQVLAKRWIVERTFAWLNRWRRLSKDYEQLPAVGESFLYIAMIRLMLRRLCT